MATLEEIHELAIDTKFRERVQSALVAKAEAVLAETSRGAPLDLSWSAMMARVNLARAIVAAPGSYVEVFARKCANNATIHGSGMVDGVVTYYANMDNDIIFVVSDKWNEVAGL